MIDQFENKECNGCKACKDICPKSAIEYIVDDEGFWYPKVNYEKCIQCKLCIKRCPNKNILKTDKKSPIVKAVWSKDDIVRIESTSGGVFYELAKYIIDNDGYVAGCVYDDDFKGAHHEIVHTLAGVIPLMVSKYVESDTENVFPRIEELLQRGEKVLFVGAACQCAGLYTYLNKIYENLYVVDFICRGANSPKAHMRYIEYLEKKFGAPIVKLRSKDKRNGWEQFGQSAVFANGKEYFADRSHDLRILAYHYGNLMVRESCLDCKFKTIPRLSDLTLGDFWGIKADEVDQIEKGVSLLFINSEKGQELFNNIGDRISFIDKTLNDAKRGNPAIYESAKCSENRKKFLDELDVLPFDCLVKKYRDRPKQGIRFYSGIVKGKIKSILKERL